MRADLNIQAQHITNSESESTQDPKIASQPLFQHENETYNELEGVGGGGADAMGAGELRLAIEAPLPGAAVRARRTRVAHLRSSANAAKAQN